MKIRSLFVLAGLATALPAAAAAQQGQYLPAGQTGAQLPHATWAVTPFVGVRVPFSTGDQFIFREDDAVSDTRVTQERGGAVLVGLEGEYRFQGPWSLVGTVGYSPSGNDVATVESGSASDDFSIDGPSILMARAGVSYRLPEPSPDRRRFHPAGFIVAGPALVRTSYDGFDAVNNWAASVGLHATAPLGKSRRFAFQLGIEDYVTFWDTESLAEIEEPILSTLLGEPVAIDYDYSVSNILTLRLGGSFRF
jgi:hypothetical protein